MFDSDKLFYVYCVGAAVTIVLGIRLSKRSKIETPVFLTLVTSHEFALIMFAVFWPVLGPAVLLEIVLRGWVRRRAREKASRAKLAANDSTAHHDRPK